ncbi:MAG TPA: serine/threonine protein kinase, partial [Streptosporangiaceae bacterium]
FGNLYPGTGLRLDMGHPVTVTGVRISLGSAAGAALQIRVGAARGLAQRPPVARAAGAAGVLRLRFSRPAHGRYVLLWFTRLPADPAGTFQASVYNIKLTGG